MKLADIKIGDCVCADGGFTCLRPGFHDVEGDDGGLFVRCDDGKHYLVGQEADGDADLVGISAGPDRRTTQEIRHDLGMKV